MVLNVIVVDQVNLFFAKILLYFKSYGYIFYFCTYNYWIMDTKLTLKLDQEIIEKAKKYASDKKMSLSRIVEAYLRSVTTDRNDSDLEISPFIKSLATGTKIPTDVDSKEYSDSLLEKYR